MPSITEIDKRHGNSVDSLLSAFEQNLEAIVARATSSLQARLMAMLAIENGDISKTPGNMRILRRLDVMFMEELEKAGYQRLLNAFASEFPGQLTFLNEVLEMLSSKFTIPQDAMKWTDQNMKVLTAVRTSTVDALTSALEGAAVSAKNATMFSVGGLPFMDLVSVLSEKLKASIGRAVTIADTAVSMFYRIAAEKTFEVIEAGLPEGRLKYKYVGPYDKLIRPFCAAHVLKAYTRAQIDAMDNDQLPNVFLTAGGWNCRHQWVPTEIQRTA